jgi:hypothetical protein
MKTSNPTTLATRRYLVEMALFTLAYMLVLAVSIWALERGLQGWVKTAVALAPVLPVLGIFFSVGRFLSRVDELTRRITLESLGIAGGVTALSAVTYGFLENAGLPHLTAWWTWSVFMFSWLIANVFVSRYYR